MQMTHWLVDQDNILPGLLHFFLTVFRFAKLRWRCNQDIIVNTVLNRKLRDLATFVQFKKCEKQHPLRSVTFSKVAGNRVTYLLCLNSL